MSVQVCRPFLLNCLKFIVNVEVVLKCWIYFFGIIFPMSLWLNSLNIAFGKQKILILMKPNLSFIYFYFVPFTSRLKHDQLF